ncbi:hypothetical protein MASR1M59_08310 [Melaminivora sp.]
MHRWNLSALATAALLSAGLYATDASALALGRLNVQSALGEPLRAEIELPQITPSEAESLRAATASPEVFRAQGAEYSPAAHSVQVQLQRRADGSMVLQLSSPRPINDPFVDLVIDANWSAGHIVRSYTLLLDPPALRRPPPASVAAAAQTQTPPAAAAPRETAARPRPAASAALPAAAPAAAPRPASDAAADAVTVRAGDTAGRLAASHRPGGVSLDQMLVAMMRANPDAFVQGNVNRLRAGSVMQLPSAADAQATSPAEARRIVAAQSRDFNEFRRRLAEAAPAAGQHAADRSASGSVQAQVQDRKPAAASPDKLTLSKGSVTAGAAAEQLATDKQAKQNTARMAELSRNLSDLKQLSDTAAAPAATAASAPASSAGPAITTPAPLASPPALPASQPAAEAAPAIPAVEAASASAEPASPVASTPVPPPAPAAAPAAKPPVTAPADFQEPSFLDSLLEDPLLPGGALALILALLGYGGWRVLQKRRAQGAVDSSFMESRRGPDSFFGASGGQRVDTANSELTTGGSSSMSYSPSQLDAGDVDPVAEADVYLAYGRDLQAEEILKEAQRHYPDRVSIPAKLAEIYAKRQDRLALEAIAAEVQRMTGGKGSEWARVAELGRSLDPANPAYQSSAMAAVAGAAAAAGAGAGAALAAAAPSPHQEAQESELPALDLDLDFDLDLHEAPPPPPAPSSFAAAAAAAQAQQQPEAAQPPAAPELNLDLGDLDLPGGTWEASRPVVESPPAPEPTSPIEFEPSPLDLEELAEAAFPHSSPVPLVTDPKDDNIISQPVPLEFDLGDLSLDLGAPSQPAALAEEPQSPASTRQNAPTELANLNLDDLSMDTMPAPDLTPAEDPLATKLALAEEFNAIGDSEGARSLVEEVIAEASGDLRTRAQRLMAQLS